jgi:hypothetical protein
MARKMSLASLRPDLKIVQFHIRTVFWEPLLVGVLVAYFLSSIPQSREVYLSLIEGIAAGRVLSFGQAVLGVALIMLLCLLLRVWQRLLGTAAIDRIYPEHADIRIDRGLCTWREILAFVSAVLPFLGLIAGVIKMTLEASVASAQFADVLAYVGKTQSKTMGFGPASATEGLPQLTYYGALAAVVLIAGFLLIVFFRRSILNWLVRGRAEVVYKAILWIGGAVTVAAIVVPMLDVTRPYIVGLARLIGPLASAALVLIAATCAAMVLSFAANMKRLPVKGTFALGALVGVAVLIYWALGPAPVKPDVATNRIAAPVKSTDQLNQSFYDWLGAREKADWPKYQAKNADYPVFIVAAEGGGIYAADAATSFLSAMQDMCPSFSQHVFAISGVSGGAVGAALFSAMQSGKPFSSKDCDLNAELFGKGTLSSQTGDMVREDHLSPAIALIAPDFARKIVSFGAIDLNERFDRSSALEASFACALAAPGRTGLRCADEEGKGALAPFGAHWKPDGVAPALVLASTWVETGYRVAFAPFMLHGASDGTLFSFPLNAGDPTDDFRAHGIRIDPSREPQTLIKAAMVSARFPGIVPAYTVTAHIEGAEKTVKWNFVDGGYVDNSGATTALEIYQKLQDLVEDQRDNPLPIGRIRLFLVLLTDANYDPNLRDVADGTSFSDTIAPVSALMSVRAQLAGRAVTRAIDQLEPKANAAELGGRGVGEARRAPRVLVVNLKQDNFNLPLGWKISNITDGVIRIILGHPSLCRERDPEAKEGDIKTVVQDNSCVKKRIIDLLDARSP